MKLFLSLLKGLLIVSLLTVLTQVGGLIYLIYKPISWRISKKVKRFWPKLAWKSGVFALLWLSCSGLLIPSIAQSLGRVSLPWYATSQVPLKPANLLTCLMNRHYVKPELRAAERATSANGSSKTTGWQASSLCRISYFSIPASLLISGL